MKTTILIFLYYFGFVCSINSQNSKNYIELINMEVNESELISEKSVNLVNRFKNNKTTSWVKLFKSSNSLIEGKNVSLNFFEDGEFFAKHIKTEKVAENEFLWKGKIKENGIVSIYNNKGKITGLIITEMNEYRIEPLNNGIHALIKIEKKLYQKGSAAL